MIPLNVEKVPMMSNGGNNEHETSSQRYICATYRKLFNSLPPLNLHKVVSHTPKIPHLGYNSIQMSSFNF